MSLLRSPWLRVFAAAVGLTAGTTAVIVAIVLAQKALA